ncbi:Glycerol-3-phosphate dehydrogenase [NAD(P)+] [Methylobrevis pamukkalensis]|uniref:Glycerol-3-phosphate dehydrogenase [NAD(P)+] n=1 Tax=Methylobrevis pamukkalensis TaxID=1439726 RepID=A0A1E3H2M5_9HYPH|nr:Glycerol-3-phosphate dehydrogenase [NAD(P)+] [Methylobrevis pamukkalensis]
MSAPRIAVLGAGAWGTALALAAARAGRTVDLVGRDAGKMAVLATSRATPHLPGVTLPPGVCPTADTACLATAGIVLVVVPAQATRSEAERLAGLIRPGTPLIACAKGIDAATGQLVGEVLAAAIPQAPVAVLSGPGFAVEVAAGLPTALTIAAEEPGLAEALCQALAGPAFRPYASEDVVASSSAARSRTCSRLPPASSPAATSGRARKRRW